MRALIALAVTFFLAAGTAFGESPKNSRAAECESGLKRAYHELDVAKARGLELSTVEREASQDTMASDSEEDLIAAAERHERRRHV